jgi:uncharacterized membrane protein YbhN (UPF0104 family)
MTRNPAGPASRAQPPQPARPDEGRPLAAGEDATAAGGRVRPDSRYRHPGDVIRLIAAGLVLAGTAITAALTSSPLIGSGVAAAAGAGLAAGAAAAMISAIWATVSWRRAAWIALPAAGAVLLVVGTMEPAEVVFALAAGITVGAGLLAGVGIPDRRIGPDGIVAALGSAGLPLLSAHPADVEARGSRPFIGVTGDGRELFVKAIGADHRDAGLLYRAYRFALLRDVGDSWPAGSVIQAAEHQALAGILAERAGVQVPHVERVIKAADGTALLVMERVGGRSLQRLTPALITDELLGALWAEVARLHRAGLAHRSLRAANVVIDAARPVLTDFSFSDLAATQRQRDLDVAELVASLAALVGADRAAASAAAALGAPGIAAAVPLLQPLALSAATRRAVKQQAGLLAQTRAAAMAAGGRDDQPMARLRRVRPRTLVTIAALAGAFYFVLPQLAQVGSSWRALQGADWAWLPAVVVSSVVTYLASAVSLVGSVPTRLPFWPTVLTQGASSFVNRVSPANVGGMAVNVRYLQKSGMSSSASVAAVGVNALAGLILHVVLIVIFFSWAGHALSQAFTLPSASKLLLALAIAAAVVGLALATRQGRRFARTRLWNGVRSAAASLRAVAASPVKLAMLTGGSALVTLAYIGGLAAAVQAFGGGVGFGVIGAVYLGAAAIGTASPTPGGLGAIEAALVAGLTGVGLSAGPAVSAVLTYRLCTYWLPALPGWVCLRVLQRKDYV